MLLNRPFSSLLQPLFQREIKCEFDEMVISSLFTYEWKLFFIRKTSYFLYSVCERAWTCGLGNGPFLESFGLTYINLSRNELRVKNRTIFDTEYLYTVYVWTADMKCNGHRGEGSNLSSWKEGWKNPKRERNSAWPCNCSAHRLHQLGADQLRVRIMACKIWNLEVTMIIYT